MISGRGSLVDSLSLAGVVAAWYFAGIPGLIIIVLTVAICDFMHKRVYGKYIAEIEPEDYHDHPANCRNVLRRLQNRERRRGPDSAVEVDGERLE